MEHTAPSELNCNSTTLHVVGLAWKMNFSYRVDNRPSQAPFLRYIDTDHTHHISLWSILKTTSYLFLSPTRGVFRTGSSNNIFSGL